MLWYIVQPQKRQEKNNKWAVAYCTRGVASAVLKKLTSIDIRNFLESEERQLQIVHHNHIKLSEMVPSKERVGELMFRYQYVWSTLPVGTLIPVSRYPKATPKLIPIFFSSWAWALLFFSDWFFTAIKWGRCSNGESEKSLCSKLEM